jgi:hypothetical protein
LGLTPVCKDFVISSNDNRLVRGSGTEQVGPMMGGTDDSEEFLVMDLIVHFDRGQGFRIIADGTQFLRHGQGPIAKGLLLRYIGMHPLLAQTGDLGLRLLELDLMLLP